MEILDCFIDKMTIVGNLPIELEYALQNLVNEEHTLIQGFPTTSNIEGQFFALGYPESVYFSYDAINAKSMGKRNFRMEFNPRKISMDQENWLKERVIYMLDDVSFSRIDIATDCNIDLSQYKILAMQASKRAPIYGLDGRLETVYLGSRTSNVYRRIYNKRTEVESRNKKNQSRNEKIEIQNSFLSQDLQKKTHELEPIACENWWRFEYELKHSTCIDSLISSNLPLFEDVRIFKPDFEGLSVNDEIYLRTLLREPEMINKLSKNSKTKYRKMIREMNADVEITDLFRNYVQKNTPKLVGELNSWRK